MNVRKFARGTLLICLMLIMSVSLTGCEGLDKVVEFVKTVVTAAKGVFDTVKPVVDAVASGTSIISQIQGILGGDSGSSTTASATTPATTDAKVAAGVDDEKSPSTVASTSTVVTPSGVPVTTITIPGTTAAAPSGTTAAASGTTAAAPVTTTVPANAGSGDDQTLVDQAKAVAAQLKAKQEDLKKGIAEVQKIIDSNAPKDVINQAKALQCDLQKTLEVVSNQAVGTSKEEIELAKKGLDNIQTQINSMVQRGQAIVKVIEQIPDSIKKVGDTVDSIIGIFSK
ncbi:MAG: hypothetical protein WA705_16260 [Candidatus Ozemobacteraceae bacterium]